MTEILFSTAFTLWGAPASWAEVLACGLALWMVRMNMREIHWGWPLAIASSLLYFFVFRHSRLYGDAGLQLFFALVALWGWFEWLRGRRADGAPLAISRLGCRGRWGALLACALLWPAIAGFLLHFTDSDVPWWDAFPTAASLVGQFLLGRKFIENWAAWLAVNLVGAGLFAYKGLWLTTLLYTVFALLSIAGWSAWRRRMADAAAAGTVEP
jgi:nicotinamide mononucleotide transporter